MRNRKQKLLDLITLKAFSEKYVTKLKDKSKVVKNHHQKVLSS